jgi:hypothetical protein
MDRITCTLKPNTGKFAVPYSTGYQTYSGLLSLIDEVDSELAGELHDTSFAALTNSGLLGDFDWGINRDYQKGVYPDAEYELRIGVAHSEYESVFNAITRALIIDDSPLELAHGSLRVTGVETESRSQQEILANAAEAADSGARGVRIDFETPTCCSRYSDVWEAHPDRIHLFKSLADQWNATVPDEERQLTLTREVLGTEVYTTADTERYDTHSIVVHRREPDEENSEDGSAHSAVTDGGTHLDEAQGFTGRWTFRFKGASEATKTAVIALSKFAEFAGIGRHTARGAGTVSVTVVGD